MPSEEIFGEFFLLHTHLHYHYLYYTKARLWSLQSAKLRKRLLWRRRPQKVEDTKEKMKMSLNSFQINKSSTNPFLFVPLLLLNLSKKELVNLFVVWLEVKQNLLYVWTWLKGNSGELTLITVMNNVHQGIFKIIIVFNIFYTIVVVK